MSKTSKYPHGAQGGFTLIELLVVVLIIGILAAIALPQYQMAVGKARFSELKTVTQAVVGSAQRYYLVNNTYTGVNNALDVEIPSTVNCAVWPESANFDRVACCKYIFGIVMCYYSTRETGRPVICLAYSSDENHNGNLLCKKETGHSLDCTSSEGGYCSSAY